MGWYSVRLFIEYVYFDTPNNNLIRGKIYMKYSEEFATVLFCNIVSPAILLPLYNGTYKEYLSCIMNMIKHYSNSPL